MRGIDRLVHVQMADSFVVMLVLEHVDFWSSSLVFFVSKNIYCCNMS